MASRKDVAERAGVSVAVVSYVLNNRSIVKPETRDKVLEAIRELGYRPNQTARSLKTRKTGQIAVLVHYLGNPFEAGLLLHIERKARAEGYGVFFHTFESGREDELIGLIAGRVDGLLVLGQSISSAALEEFRTMGLPVASVLRPGGAGDSPLAEAEYPVLDIDWTDAFRRLIVHLRMAGHAPGRIAFMAGGGERSPISHRERAFREALRLEGGLLEDFRLLRGAGRFETAEEELFRALGGGGFDATAIVCANDLMAAGCLAACRSAGVRVPRDLAVAGCEDILMSSQTNPPLTAIRYPREEAGVEAVRLLLARIRGGADSVAGESPAPLASELIVRESTVGQG